VTEDDGCLVVIIDQPGRTMAQLRRVVEALGPDPIDGQIAHAVGTTATGLRHVEIWTSREKADRFGHDRLLPAFKAVYGTDDFGPAEISEFTASWWSSTSASSESRSPH
jgi:hypothetical protein